MHPVTHSFRLHRVTHFQMHRITHFHIMNVSTYLFSIVSNLKLTAFTKTYDHLTTLLPIYILANLYFKGSIVMNNFDLFASFIASIDRLFLFMKNIQELDPNRPNDDALVMNPRVIDTPIIDSTGIVLTESITLSPSRPILLIRNLHLRTPDDKRILIRTLNLSLITGQNLLISGVSGAGKSSLLRAIAGLWRNGGGNIARSSDIYFLPQRP
jgi:putative ATP-binding cassette transporter